MDVARHAAALFWQHGFDATSGDAIAAAAGLSKRTVWRYFRSKEACVEPLFRATSFAFIDALRDWPPEAALEDYLLVAMRAAVRNEQWARDGLAAARIISMLEREPTLRSAHLLASVMAEAELAKVFAARLGRRAEDFDVKLCAATAMAAIRIVDEDVCIAVLAGGQQIGMEEATARLAAAIRTACTLPVCDPQG